MIEGDNIYALMRYDPRAFIIPPCGDLVLKNLYVIINDFLMSDEAFWLCILGYAAAAYWIL